MRIDKFTNTYNGSIEIVLREDNGLILGSIVIDRDDIIGIISDSYNNINDTLLDEFLDKFAKKSLDKLTSNNNLNRIYNSISEDIRESSETAINEFMYGKVNEPQRGLTPIEVYNEINTIILGDIRSEILKLTNNRMSNLEGRINQLEAEIKLLHNKLNG